MLIEPSPYRRRLNSNPPINWGAKFCQEIMSEQFSKYGEGLLVRAAGKINLSLLVKSKRTDGYHDIETIMAKIDLYDEILIERRTEDRRRETEDSPRSSDFRFLISVIFNLFPESKDPASGRFG